MISSSNYRIELLDPAKHRRDEFDCGVEVLNDYLKRRANQEMKSQATACYVVTPEQDVGRIAGYYTLSASVIEPSEIPEPLRKKLPRYDQLGATLVGRLARDKEFAANIIGESIGEILLMSALLRSYRAASLIGAAAVVVDAKDVAAERFYKRFGFLHLKQSRFFLPMKDVPKWNSLA
jgi:hypothetical protein